MRFSKFRFDRYRAIERFQCGRQRSEFYVKLAEQKEQLRIVIADLNCLQRQTQRVFVAAQIAIKTSELCVCLDHFWIEPDGFFKGVDSFQTLTVGRMSFAQSKLQPRLGGNERNRGFESSDSILELPPSHVTDSRVCMCNPILSVELESSCIELQSLLKLASLLRREAGLIVIDLGLRLR